MSRVIWGLIEACLLGRCDAIKRNFLTMLVVERPDRRTLGKDK